MGRFRKFLLFILVIAAFLFLLQFQRGSATVFKFFFSPTLQQTVEKSLAGTTGRYAVYIKNLKTGQTYSLRTDEIFEVGSLYKLWVMGTVFKKIKASELKEADSIEGDIVELNTKFGIASEEAELTEGHLQYTIKSALEQMITISHNYAAFMLTEKVGNEAIADFLKEYGLSKSSLNPPQATASDLAKLLEGLYQGKIVDETASRKMLELLLRQKINDRIPKLLPKDTKVAHKTADIGFFEHDVGIVFSKKADYMIVVLSESQSPQAAGERIADLSKAIYDYFAKVN